ncbi:MAG: hypothetical protein SCARUB_04193 [Candidatus Scalindua rubra]|uniref:Nucleotidyl transferase AbiEii toxin, Type IV TA system n=1 Tax=Candidatus Scalindua rubra TaxID=1872076 RepID=A0A1E3X4W1_9BACT|nr:MAG: hypothetical protein SCARUB_04193 [Candidatus Scalindua rubra]
MSFKTNAVPNEVIDLLLNVRPIIGKIGGVYLAGGTALSLFLGHRISIDLDFFTPNDFLAAPLSEALNQLGPYVPIDVKNNSLVCKVKEVQFSLFKYGYPLLCPFEFYSNISIASLRDIAAMKIGAIGDRGARKDFYDLYAILNYTSIKIENILKDVCTKFSIPKDSLYHYIKALAFFEDSRKEPDIQPLVKLDVKWEDIELFFSKLATTLIPRSFPH